MIYSNEQNKDKTIVNILKEFGVDGLVPYLSELEARIKVLEEPKKVGRPKKVANA